jgi:hypothetical protein
MRDGIDGRIWAEHHQSFSDLVGGFLGRVYASFERLNAIQYETPWRSAPPPQA